MKKIIFLLIIFFPLVGISQIIEDFSDSEISNNPTWTGETSKFEVINPPTSGDGSINASANNDGLVLRSMQSIGDAVLTLPSTYAYGEWFFSIADGYNWLTSSTNDYYVVLISNDSTPANLKDGAKNFNGYFLRFDGGVNDQFVLYKQTGTTETVILSTGYPTSIDGATAIGRTVKITRNVSGEWNIYIDEGFDVNPTTLRGTVTENTHQTSDYFAIATNIANPGAARVVYFDNLYIGEEIGDTIKPQLSSIDVLSMNTVKLNFSEAIDSTIAESLSNYSVDNSIGNPTSANYDSNSNSVTLTFGTNFTDELQNTITIQNIEDESGNIIETTTENFIYTLIKALSVDYISTTEIDINFSQDVESISATTLTNYSVNNSIGNPTTATVDGTDAKIVHLTFNNSFVSGTQYSINIQNITDLNSNPILSTDLNFSYFIASANDIVINEIMADPTPVVALPNAEYIELYNTTAFDIPLQNWTITTGTSVKTFTNVTIPANDYLIVCTTGFESEFSTYGTTTGLLSTYALTNSGTSITLADDLSNTISSVTFYDTWYQDDVKKDGGWSIEKIDPSNNCGGQSNWIASVSSMGGTPGAINSVDAPNTDSIAPSVTNVLVLDSNSVAIYLSEKISEPIFLNDFTVDNSIGNPSSYEFDVTNNTILYLHFDSIFSSGVTNKIDIENLYDNCGNSLDSVQFEFSYFAVSPYDVVINEIMADPNPIVDLPDYEYIELYNRTYYDIDMIGWTLTVGTTTVDIPSTQIQGGGFILLCSNYAELSLSFYGTAIGIYNIPALVNTGKLITIKDANGTIITSVEYSDEWYNDATKNDGGWSLELIDPNNTCGELYNWTASDDVRGGTPGIQNSVFGNNIDSTIPTVEQSLVYTQTHLIVGFSEVLNKSAAETATNYFVNNSIGAPDSARVDSDDRTLVHLYFSNEFAEATQNALDISNLYDLCDNPLSDTAIYFTYFKTNPYDVVINEFMCDPEPAIELPLYEYVELYNRTNHDIDLINWTFKSGSTTTTIPPSKIKANDYLILCSHSIASTFATYGSTVSFSSFPALGNTEGILIIRDMYDNIVTTVSYTNEWYQSTYKDDGGWSLEQIDPENPCGEEHNWIASTDTKGGTPGAQNSVYEENADNLAPELIRASIYNTVTLDTVQLFFDEPLNIQFLNDVDFYNVDNNVGNPVGIIPIEPDYKSIMLAFNTTFEQGIIYTVSIVDTIYDCVGNAIEINDNCKFAVPDTIESNDFVINEVLFDPLTNGVDYVELYNRSDKNIDLKDVRIANRNDLDSIDNVKFVSETSYLLFPESFVVLTTDPEIVQEQYYAENPDAFIKVSSLPTFSNDEGNVIMTDKWLNIIDDLHYTDKMHYALLNSLDGVALERINYNTPSSEESNWHSAAETVGYGTPTYQNSQYSAETTSSDEVTVEPEIFSPDNDGYNDVLNIHYKLDNPDYTANIVIYDSKGRIVKRIANNVTLAMSGTLTWDGLNDANDKAGIGIYILFFEAFDLEGNIVNKKLSFVLATKL